MDIETMIVAQEPLFCAGYIGQLYAMNRSEPDRGNAAVDLYDTVSAKYKNIKNIAGPYLENLYRAGLSPKDFGKLFFVIENEGA